MHTRRPHGGTQREPPARTSPADGANSATQMVLPPLSPDEGVGNTARATAGAGSQSLAGLHARRPTCTRAAAAQRSGGPRGWHAAFRPPPSLPFRLRVSYRTNECAAASCFTPPAYERHGGGAQGAGRARARSTRRGSARWLARRETARGKAATLPTGAQSAAGAARGSPSRPARAPGARAEPAPGCARDARGGRARSARMACVCSEACARMGRGKQLM